MKCVWCYCEITKKNKSKDWCDPCCKVCATYIEEKDKEWKEFISKRKMEVNQNEMS